MQIFRIEVGPLSTNCYLVYDETTLDGVVIDPGDSAGLILSEIQKRDLHIRYIINTHGHWDHTGADAELKEKTDAKMMIHQDDLSYLSDSGLSMSMYMGGGKKAPEPDILLQEDDVIQFGGCTLKVLHTPGHTPGGVSLLGDNVVFSGDTLFMQSVGRTDLPGGNGRALMESIRTKLATLPAETVVCPGHGPTTSIGVEKRINPYLQSN